MELFIMYLTNMAITLVVFNYELLDKGLIKLSDKFENLIYKIKHDLLHVILLQLKASFIVGFNSILVYFIFVTFLKLKTIGIILYLITHYYVIKNYVSNKKLSINS